MGVEGLHVRITPPSLVMKTTLEAAAEFGSFTEAQAMRFCSEHEVLLSDAVEELGSLETAMDAVELCRLIGY